MRMEFALAGCLVLLTACDPLSGEAQEAVKRLLRDPESAQFRDVQHCAKPNAVQGEVNARNGMGGYMGFRQFIYADRRAAIVDVNPEEFGRLLRLCYSDQVLKDSGVAAMPIAPPSPRDTDRIINDMQAQIDAASNELNAAAQDLR